MEETGGEGGDGSGEVQAFIGGLSADGGFFERYADGGLVEAIIYHGCAVGDE